LKSVNCSKPGYTSISCSKIEHIPYNLIFTTKFNDSLILITIISWDYLNLSLANEYVGDVTIPTQVIKYNLCSFRQISQSDCTIHTILNYQHIILKFQFFLDYCFRTFFDNSFMTFHENLTSSEVVLDAHTANRRKYVSWNFDGTKWILPSSLIDFSNISFLSFFPCNIRNEKNYE